uniref:Serpin domain-containing protein n=1 Tax=Meloidogyne floridensis TaxID=298350 RepID=A0A915P337_9BILA
MAIIKAQADFAINLLSNVVLEQNKPVESTILSPLSLSMGLAMVYAGADGETKKDFGELLSGEEETHAYFGKQLNSYNDDKPKNYTLEMANKVFVQKGFKILEEFKNFINENYGGRFELLNFEENVEAAKLINEFVEKSTHDKIKNIISPDALNSDTRLLLINAIYFKGKWISTFDPKLTYKTRFYISEENFIEVDMMKKENNFVYFENDEVHLPKFKFESTHDLKDVLIKLGINSAFENANFSNITIDKPLKIDKVVQKAFIELNEEGTEAVATTFDEYVEEEGRWQPPSFVANHPFTFMIVKKTEILFCGIYQG